jgi:hypothetical protein
MRATNDSEDQIERATLSQMVGSCSVLSGSLQSDL